MLIKLLEEKLREKNVTRERFQEITNRLMAYGVIVRADESVEQRLYDDARRIENIIEEVFFLIGFRLLHDSSLEFFRLYPPGAQVPGVADDGNEPVPSLRARLSPDFVAAALALRFLYQQGLHDGTKLTDSGEVMVRFEDIAAAMQTNLRRKMPDTLGEKKQILNELRRHRLVNFGGNFDLNDDEVYLTIRPTILSIIGEDAMAAALEGVGIEEEETATEEGEL
ncbi:DUF4194 domain-containing protein [Noviherbaspirillum saxi]|uniref:DUF4194 domain-containing protein n=1 Tax=Noviherbaspirillum saxi TaxID=2320863 RepID=A0A3A3FJC2_9BURK|nr:DUF4194 domain-containing protein [Noviherbaspirillum saxi]RJF92478.1 DUF4194 domain-containing protein [Noviherbaspirillum saxi]